MSRASIIRDSLITALESKLDDEAFTLNNFVPTATHLPIDELPNLETPRVWLVTLGGDEAVNNRAGEWSGERAIQLILKQSVSLDDTTDCDRLETLLDELKQACREHSGSSSIVYDARTFRFNYSPTRIEVLRDPAGTGYAFGLLRKHGVFEGAFNAFYQLTSE